MKTIKPGCYVLLLLLLSLPIHAQTLNDTVSESPFHYRWYPVSSSNSVTLSVEPALFEIPGQSALKIHAPGSNDKIHAGFVFFTQTPNNSMSIVPVQPETSPDGSLELKTPPGPGVTVAVWTTESSVQAQIYRLFRYSTGAFWENAYKSFISNGTGEFSRPELINNRKDMISAQILESAENEQVILNILMANRLLDSENCYEEIIPKTAFSSNNLVDSPAPSIEITGPALLQIQSAKQLDSLTWQSREPVDLKISLDDQQLNILPQTVPASSGNSRFIRQSIPSIADLTIEPDQNIIPDANKILSGPAKQQLNKTHANQNEPQNATSRNIITGIYIPCGTHVLELASDSRWINSATIRYPDFPWSKMDPNADFSKDELHQIASLGLTHEFEIDWETASANDPGFLLAARKTREIYRGREWVPVRIPGTDQLCLDSPGGYSRLVQNIDPSPNMQGKSLVPIYSGQPIEFSICTDKLLGIVTLYDPEWEPSQPECKVMIDGVHRFIAHQTPLGQGNMMRFLVEPGNHNMQIQTHDRKVYTDLQITNIESERFFIR